jgi:hypothetical protein
LGWPYALSRPRREEIGTLSRVLGRAKPLTGVPLTGVPLTGARPPSRIAGLPNPPARVLLVP